MIYKVNPTSWDELGNEYDEKIFVEFMQLLFTPPIRSLLDKGAA